MDAEVLRMAENLAGLFYLTKSQVKSAAEVLAKAFWDYPMSVYFWPDEAKRTKRQLALCRRQVYTGIKYGEVYATSPQMEGVSVWFPSDRGHE
jgi:hypothetical protein